MNCARLRFSAGLGGIIRISPSPEKTAPVTSPWAFVRKARKPRLKYRVIRSRVIRALLST